MFRIFIPVIAAVFLLTGAGCSSTCPKPAGAGARLPEDLPGKERISAPVASKEAAADISRQWGVNVESLRLSAHGHLLDARYRVTDAGKAAALADPKSKAFLIHEATGIRLKVPSMPKVGTLRSTATRLTPGTIYVMLFANQGQVVKASDLVTLEIGKCRIEHLKVQ